MAQEKPRRGTKHPHMTTRDRRHARAAALAAATLVAMLAAIPVSSAQMPPLPGSSTTSTPSSPTTQPARSDQPAASPTTTAPAPSGDGLAGGDRAPEGAKDPGGDGAAAPSGGIRVPPDAQRIIDSVHRTGATNTQDLAARASALQSFGISEAEAYRVGLGRFPIAGPAHYGHDWLYPRYGPGFRFHLGTDVFAAYGTPVRAPVDGVARSNHNGLGGLTVKVFMPDGTYFYLAHLSGLVEGFADGMAVSTGDIVGYVGDSGNARGGAPHLHIGIYPHGGPPIDPKPLLDGFVAEAEARLPEVVAALQAAQAAVPPSTLAVPAVAPVLAPPARLDLLAGGGASVPVELLYAAGANPISGPRALVRLALDDLAAGIDWTARAR
jgi:murein DD-endopeptidase MepM/ murein hydrolase activator NlpD